MTKSIIGFLIVIVISAMAIAALAQGDPEFALLIVLAAGFGYLFGVRLSSVEDK